MSLSKKYTAAEVAENFGVSEEWLKEQARSGRFPHIRAGYRGYRFTEAHVAGIEKMLEQSPKEAGTLADAVISTRSRARRRRRSS